MFKFEHPTTIFVADAFARPCGIYVPLNNMSIQSTISSEASLQIDVVTDIQGAQIAPSQCFVDRGNSVCVIAQRHYCQANPVVRDALVDLQLMADLGPDHQMGIGAFRLDRDEFSFAFYNTGEHGVSLWSLVFGSKVGAEVFTVHTRDV